MVVHKDSGKIEHKVFRDVIDYFDEKDVLVLNNTKVFPARLYGTKEKTAAKIEVFLLRELNREMRLWDVLVDPARKIRSEEHTSELQSLMRISYAVFCLKKKKHIKNTYATENTTIRT